MNLDFTRCRDVWVPDDSEAGGFWSPPPEHVKVGVREIIANQYFLLADDMGGMKTAQAIISAQFMHDMGMIDRVIVVAPAAVRPKVWFDKDLGQLNEQAFDDKRNKVTEYHAKIRSWSRGPEGAPELRWIVTNYEYIRSRRNLNALLPYCGPKTFLILDESSAVRGWDSAQTEACMLLRWKQNRRGRPVMGVPRCGRILELNGTPVAESPMDLFAQGNLLHPSVLDCKYVTHFRARYAVEAPTLGANGKPLVSPYPKRERQEDGSVKLVPQSIVHTVGWDEEGLKDLQLRFAPYVLRREAKDFGIDFALPPVALEVRLTDATWKIYRSMRDEMVAWLKSGVATATQAGVKSIRLSQITSGFLGGIEDAGFDDPDAWMDEVEGQTKTTWAEALAYAGGQHGDVDGDLWGEGSQGDALGRGDTREAGARAGHRDVASGAAERPNGPAPSKVRARVEEVGREKLDFALEWHAELLRRYPELKLLTWCRFVPELRRYLAEVQQFGHPVGAACGESVLGGRVKDEREAALRLLHPKTAPKGAVTVGATQGTGAMGLNFTACRTVLDMSYDFSPFKKKQGDARVNRTGQTGPVSFFYLVAVGPRGQKTIDHHVLMVRMGKMSVNDFTTSYWVKALMEE